MWQWLSVTLLLGALVYVLESSKTFAPRTDKPTTAAYDRTILAE